MSDKIRIDLTPEEAQKVREAVAYRKLTCNWLTPELDSAFAKIVKAEENPLNGVTFPAQVDPLNDYFHGTHERDMAIDAEDEAVLDAEQEAFESIPEGEIPY